MSRSSKGLCRIFCLICEAPRTLQRLRFKAPFETKFASAEHQAQVANRCPNCEGKFVFCFRNEPSTKERHGCYISLLNIESPDSRERDALCFFRLSINILMLEQRISQLNGVCFSGCFDSCPPRLQTGHHSRSPGDYAAQFVL